MKSTLIWVVRFVFKHTSSIMALDSDTSFLHFVWRRISELGLLCNTWRGFLSQSLRYSPSRGLWMINMIISIHNLWLVSSSVRYVLNGLCCSPCLSSLFLRLKSTFEPQHTLWLWWCVEKISANNDIFCSNHLIAHETETHWIFNQQYFQLLG